MSQQPPWDPYGQQDPGHDQGQPPDQGKPPYGPPGSQPPLPRSRSRRRPAATSRARFLNAAIAVVLLILAGASVFSFVELSHAQRQISATRSELSAEQQQVSSDEQQLTSLESRVNSPPSDPLSAFSSTVCSNPDVYDSSTGQTITAYYPCTETNPN
jgi:hypothetical protein